MFVTHPHLSYRHKGPGPALPFALLSAFICILFGGGAGVTMAGAADTSAEGKESKHAEAKRYFKIGKQAFKEKKYDDAREAYEQAYARVALPALLFNIGQCHRNVGQLDQAIEAFNRYLRDAPKASNRKAVKSLLRQLKKEQKISAKKQAQNPASKNNTAESSQKPQTAQNSTDNDHALKPDLDNLPDAQSLYGEPSAGDNNTTGNSTAVNEAAPFDPMKEAEEEAKRNARQAQAGEHLIVRDSPKAATTTEASSSRRFYQTWWFWTLSGVVLAGAITGITLASQSNTTNLPPSRLPSWELPRLR